MRSMSIRTKILSGVVAVNLIGMVVVMIYLHQSYSGGLDVTAQKSATQGVAAWNEITKYGLDNVGPLVSAKAATEYLESMKEITGAEYGLLLTKGEIQQASYEKEREQSGLPSNWDDRENYVLAAVTNETTGENMQIETPADSIPEIGKLVGVENGACSKTCHGAVTGEGDFWQVRWSTDSVSRAHTVFPVADPSSGKVIGLVYEIEDISRAADAARSSMVQTIIVIITGLFIATLLIGWMLDALVFKRLRRMIVSIEDLSMRVAGGDFDAHYTPDGTDDEIGHFEQFFARFIDLVSGTLKSFVK